MSTIKRIYTRKIIRYGNYIDYVKYYENQYTHHSVVQSRTKSKEGTKRADSIQRARISIYRLIAGNIGRHNDRQGVFATYTFAKSMYDISAVYSRYREYTRRYKRHYGEKLEYVAVAELHKSGAYHMHAVLFNVDRLDFEEHDKIWKYGRVNIKKLKTKYGADGLAKYLSKYLSKEVFDTLINKPLYLCSRGLIRPEVSFGDKSIDNSLSSDKVKLLTIHKGYNALYKKFKKNDRNKSRICRTKSRRI